MKYRTFTILTLLALLLVSIVPLAAQDTTPEPTPEATEQPSAEIYTDAASLVVLEETDDTRVIQHTYGETEIPADPQRIITLQDQNALLPILIFGEGDRVIGSVGNIQEDGTEIFRRTQDYDTSNVTFVGIYGTPNLELITELEPDLIVGDQFEVTDENYETLSQIAPTVAVEQFTRSIWGSMFDFALLVNAQDEAIALKTDYDERVASIQDALEDPSEITVSVISGRPEGFRVVGSSNFTPSKEVISDIGLSIPPFQQGIIDEGEFNSDYSLESIQQMNGDVLYVVDFFGSSESLLNSPLYNTLGAVQSEQAYVVDGQRFVGISSQALFAWLDVFEETLLVDDLDTGIVEETSN